MFTATDRVIKHRKSNLHTYSPRRPLARTLNRNSKFKISNAALYRTSPTPHLGFKHIPNPSHDYPLFLQSPPDLVHEHSVFLSQEFHPVAIVRQPPALPPVQIELHPLTSPAVEPRITSAGYLICTTQVRRARVTGRPAAANKGATAARVRTANLGCARLTCMAERQRGEQEREQRRTPAGLHAWAAPSSIGRSPVPARGCWLLGGSLSWLSRTVFILVGLASLCLIPSLCMGDSCKGKEA